MKSPIYERHEDGENNFNPQVDFSQFLEEAKKYKTQVKFEFAPQCAQGASKKTQSDEKQKKIKSWKRSLISWWKADKKNNPSMEPPTSSHTCKPRRGGRVSASGLIYECGSGASLKPRGPKSGPLTSLFLPNKRVENETPYTCLEKLKNPNVVESYGYGPVYLVT